MEETVVSPEAPASAGERTAFMAPRADVTQAAITLTCPVCRTDNPPGERWCRDCGFLLGSPVGEALEIPEPATGPRLIDSGGREYTLRAGANSIGRENADILLPDPTVSRAHARLTLEDAEVWVEDTGSTNGTRIGGQTITAGERTPVRDGDELRFGSVILRLALAEGAGALPADESAEPRAASREPRAGEAVARLVAADGVEHPLRLGRTTAGRRADNEIVISGDPYVSGRHATFICEEAACSVLDLGSTNGTFLHGERLREGQPQALAPGDEVRLGQSVFLFQALDVTRPEPEPDEQEGPAGEDEAAGEETE